MSPFRLLLAAVLGGVALGLAGCFGGDNPNQVEQTFYVDAAITTATSASGTFEAVGASRDSGEAALEFDPFGDPPRFLRGTAELTGANGTVTLRFEGGLVTTSPPSLTGAASTVSIGTFEVTSATGGYDGAVGLEGRAAIAIDGEARTVRAAFGPEPDDATDEPPPGDETQ